VPRVTALTVDRRARGQVLVELDGAPWRRLPAEAVARAGLTVDAELGRIELRALRRELRRTEALDAAARALLHRDRSRATVDARLAAARIAPWARGQALDALERAGVVDDERFASARAAALARRGSGDALIRAELLAAGVAAEAVTDAIGELEPERERAVRLVAARGQSPATARWLARRGFAEHTIEAALPRLIADES
jgi:SOS response regulatory protein OraA/RecX